MHRRPPPPGYLLGLLLFTTQALAATPNRHEFTLENGLHVSVTEDLRAPVVTTHLLIKVGSSHEYPGQSGLSHALEHLLFRGTSKTAPGAFSQIIERLGGSDNAYTNRDFTVYHQTLPSDRLAVAIELNADLLKGARLEEAEFARAIAGVKAERRQDVDDYPQGMLYEQLQTIAYPASSYHTPAIGWMVDLERMHNDELKAWYRTWYAPNNATLIVVGNVQLDDVKAQVERFFAGFARQDLPGQKLPLQPMPAGPRQVTVYNPTSTPMLSMAFNVPGYATAATTADVDALRLIQALLGAGQSARLSTRLAREQGMLASPMVSYAPLARGDTTFDISAYLNAAHAKPLAKLKHAIWAELQALKHTPATAQDLARARALLLANNVFAQDSLQGQAEEIAKKLGSGLPVALLDDDEKNLAQVTPEHIQQVAKTYFTHERMAVAYSQAKEANDE